MSERSHFYKHRRAKRTFTVRWGASPQLASAAWSVTPAGELTVGASSTTEAGDALARLDGGVAGQRYTVACDATFADGQTDVEEFEVTVT